MSKVKERFSGSIALTKLKHVKMMGKSKNGPVEGIFIPIELNYVTKGKLQKDDQGNDIPNSEPLYLSIDVIVFNERSDRGQDGMLAQKLDTKTYKEIGKEKAQELKLPILGNIKNFANEQPDDVSGDAGSAKQFTPDDDLPF
jgi:hypothetical protein